ncbi:hypothetical protein HY468_00205 [Candidatus Roizmanbacteria bacterium]|nr:hypothetical protein [Candidatus Roizmanbacteria bacterium]
MLSEAKYKEGKAIIYILLGVIVVLLGGVFLIASGKNQSGRPSQESKTVSPTGGSQLSWATFNNPKLQIALNYPTTYFFEDVTESSTRLKSLLAVNFAPKNESLRETDSVFLTVYPKGSVTSAAYWVDRYTSADNRPQSGTPSAKYFNVSNISESGAGMTYIQSFPDTTQKLETTVVATDKYIILVSHTEGNAIEIYQKMLSSLTY